MDQLKFFQTYNNKTKPCTNRSAHKILTDDISWEDNTIGHVHLFLSNLVFETTDFLATPHKTCCTQYEMHILLN